MIDTTAVSPSKTLANDSVTTELQTKIVTQTEPQMMYANNLYVPTQESIDQEAQEKIDAAKREKVKFYLTIAVLAYKLFN